MFQKFLRGGCGELSQKFPSKKPSHLTYNHQFTYYLQPHLFGVTKMKQNFLERTYHLRTSDFDMRNRILPASVLDLFQDAAGEHATALGVGYYDLLPENKCWMILRTRYEVIRQPKLFSDVTVRTWPIESRRIEFDRDYIMYDSEGNVLSTCVESVTSMCSRATSSNALYWACLKYCQASYKYFH